MFDISNISSPGKLSLDYELREEHIIDRTGSAQ